MASKDSDPDYHPAEFQHQSEEGAVPSEVDQAAGEGADPSAAGASVSQNLFDQLLASIQNGDAPRSNFIFDQLARMSKAAAIWNNTCDRIFCLSASDKIKFLEQVAGARHLHLAEGTPNTHALDELLLDTIAHPAMHQLLMHTPENATMTTLNRLTTLVDQRIQEGSKIKKGVASRVNSLLAHLKRCLFRFMNEMVSHSQLPNIKNLIRRGENKASAFSPFENAALLRIFEFCPRGRPLQLHSSNLATTFRHRRDGTLVRGDELVKILLRLEARVGAWMQEQKSAGIRSRVSLINVGLVDQVIQELMADELLPSVISEPRVKLKDMVFEFDEDMEINDPKTEGEKNKKGKKQKPEPGAPPGRYDNVKKVGRGNDSDYDPAKEAEYCFFHELGMDQHPLIKAQSFAATKLVRELRDTGIPLDLLFPSGRLLRKFLKLPVGGPTDFVSRRPPVIDLIFLLSPSYRQTLSTKLNNLEGQEVHVIAPCVVAMDQYICSDANTAIAREKGREKWLVDTESDGQRSRMQCPFFVDQKFTDNSDKTDPNNYYPPEQQFPVVPFASDRALLATPPSALDAHLRRFVNDVSNLFVNATNFVLAQMLEKEMAPKFVPEPSSSIPVQEFYLFLQAVRDCNPKYKEGRQMFTAPADEVKYWPCAQELHPPVAAAAGGRSPYSSSGSSSSPRSPPLKKARPGTPTSVPTVAGAPRTVDNKYFTPNQNVNMAINRTTPSCAGYANHQDASATGGNQLTSALSETKQRQTKPPLFSCQRKCKCLFAH